MPAGPGQLVQSQTRMFCLAHIELFSTCETHERVKSTLLLRGCFAADLSILDFGVLLHTTRTHICLGVWIRIYPLHVNTAVNATRTHTPKLEVSSQHKTVTASLEGTAKLIGLSKSICTKLQTAKLACRACSDSVNEWHQASMECYQTTILVRTTGQWYAHLCCYFQVESLVYVLKLPVPAEQTYCAQNWG